MLISNNVSFDKSLYSVPFSIGIQMSKTVDANAQPRFFHRMITVLAILQARYQMYLNMHPIIYYLCNAIGACHFWITVLYPSNEVVRLVAKWFDISYPQHGFDIRYVMVLCSIFIYSVFYLLLRQIYVSASRNDRQEALSVKLFERYAFTIVGGLGIFISTALMLTIIRSCLLNILMGTSNGAYYYLAWTSLITYCCVVLPFHSVFLADLSLLSGNIYASLHFINYMRIMPVIRVVLCFALVLQAVTHPGFVFAALIISLLAFYKQPVWHYNKDRQIRTVFYMMTWILIIRTIASLYGQPIQGGVVIVCSVVFPYFLMSLTSSRVQKLLMQQNITVKKIKILSSFMNDFKAKLKHLSLFYMTHRKECSDPQCTCYIVNVSSLSKPQGVHFWYEMFNDLIRKHFNINSMQSLTRQKKEILLNKLIELTFVQVDILSRGLNQQNNALGVLTKVMNYARDNDVLGLHLEAYDLRYRTWMEAKMVYETGKDDAINHYAKNYIHYQIKVIKLHNSIRDSVQKHHLCWGEVLNQYPDVQKVVQSIVRAYKSNLEVQKALKQLLAHDDIEAVVFPVYKLYFKQICNIALPRPKKRLQMVERISIDMKNFAYEAQTGACLVSIANDKTFSNIILSNLFFEKLLGWTVNGNINVSMLTPDPFITFHTRKQKAFIASGGYLIENVRVLMKKKSGHILDVTQTIQIVPSLRQGFVASVFFFPQESIEMDIVFLCDSDGKLIAHSTTFENEVLNYYAEHQLDELGRTFTRNVLNKLRECGGQKGTGPDWKVDFALGKKNWRVTLRRQFHDSITNQSFFVLKMEELSPDKQLHIAGDACSQRCPSTNSILQITRSRENRVVTIQAEQEFWRSGTLRKSNEEQLNDVFSLIQNRKNSSTLRIWIASYTVLILLIVVAAIFSTVFVGEKAQLAKHFDDVRMDYHNIQSLVSDGLFYMRWANIEAFTTKSQKRFAYYVSRFKQCKIDAVRIYSSLQKKPLFSQKSYFVEDSGEIFPATNDFFLSLEWIVFGSLQNLAQAEIQDMGFSFLRSEIPKPYNNFQKKFIAANLNGLLITLPNFQNAIEQTIMSQRCQLGKCIQNQRIVQICLLALILISILLVLSCCMAQRTKSLREEAFHLIELMPRSIMMERKAMTSAYKEQHFPTVALEHPNQDKVAECGKLHFSINFQKRSQPLQQVELAQQSKEESFANILHMFVDRKLSSSYDLNENRGNQRSTSIMSRSNEEKELKHKPKPRLTVFTSQWGKKKESHTTIKAMDTEGPMQALKTEREHIMNTDRPAQSELIFVRNGLKRTFLKYFLLLAPLAFFFGVLALLHLLATDHFISHFQTNDVINNEIQLTKQVKLYTLEIGLQGQNLYANQSASVIQFLTDRIEHAYIVERRLFQIFSGDDRTSQEVNLLYEHDMCGSLAKLQPLRTDEVQFTEEECRNLRGNTDLTQGSRAALILLLEKVRMIKAKYGNCTRQEREEFLTDESLKLISAQDHYFEATSRYLLKLYREDLNFAILVFENTIYTVTAFTVALAFGVMILLGKYVTRGFFQDIVAIKAVFHLLSKENIKANKRIQLIVLEKMNFSLIE